MVKKTKAIISDLDGTLALMGDRNPYTPKTVLDDKLNFAPADIVRTYFKYRDIPTIVVSGRFERYRKETEEWFKKHNLENEIVELYLRGNDDYRKDYTFKREAFEKKIKPNYDILFCLDDRNQSVAFWRSLGLTCLQVAPGDF